MLEDLCAIWDWILNEKLHIPQDDRNMFSAILVVPETFDSRGKFSFINFPKHLIVSLLLVHLNM